MCEGKITNKGMTERKLITKETKLRAGGLKKEKEKLN
jgi:hypothetical protein